MEDVKDASNERRNWNCILKNGGGGGGEGV